MIAPGRSIVTLTAPMAGWLGGLETVPDPVFAGGMMGAGVAIDPLEGVVRAPCDGVVSVAAATGHAVSLRAENGAEVLIHVGIDTVALAGAGFALRVAVGDHVAAGDVLIAFDLDGVALAATSLFTPIVIANDGFSVTVRGTGRRVAAGEAIMDIAPVSAAEAPPPGPGDDTARIELVVPLANGIHARPAARIAAALKAFDAEVRASSGRNADANARSPVAMLALGIRHGDTLILAARGRDARAAVTAIAALIEGGMDEAGPAPVAAAIAPAPTAVAGQLRGIRAAPGLAVGPVFRFEVAAPALPETGAGVAAETAALGAALAAVAAGLVADTSAPQAEIIAAHRAMIEDPALLEAAHAAIAAGASAPRAWRGAIRAQAATIEATGDRRLIERIADLRDLEGQVIAQLLGVAALPATAVPPGAIIIADELLPSQFLALAPAGIAGIVTAGGGPTSHVAILAAAAGLPMLVATAGCLDLADGAMVVLAADAGNLDVAPGAVGILAAQAQIAARTKQRAAQIAAASAPCRTADGVRIEVFANLGSLADAEAAVAAGAEGCGLLRTEFLFLDRATAPTEAEQRGAYAAIAAALGGRPLIVRTLDIGGDKPVPYLPAQPEDNPALGQRGIRLGLARPDLLRTQLRAILAGVPAAQCRIMLPMIVDVGEFRAVRALLSECAGAIGRGDDVPLGVMVETPAAALLARGIAAEAAFLSLGTNDLTQYALAADRGNPAVAARVDALHPAVLRLIALAAEGAQAHRRWLGVCGSIASDPLAAAVLIGLGVTELSATPAAIPALKAMITGLNMADCRALAARALALDTADAVHALLRESR